VLSSYLGEDEEGSCDIFGPKAANFLSREASSMELSGNHTPITTLKQHLVQFYESEISLLNAVSAFIIGGLRVGDACIVLSTREHRKSFLEYLQREGVDVSAAEAQGRYIWVDAAEILLKFMVAGMPEPGRFVEVVGGAIVQAAQGQRHVRVFGEMVALLWSQGSCAAALALEELGNDLQNLFPDTSLFCAYPMYLFERQDFGKEFLKICLQHSHVIPAGAYSLHSSLDEQLQAISLLQQKASAFEVGLAQLKEIERHLRLSEEEHFRLAAIVESSDDAIVSKTLDGIITSWNAAAERLFGYSSQEAVGKHITLIIPPELYREEEEIISKLRRGIRIQHYETVRVRKDGKRVDVSLSISPVRDRSGRIIGAAKIARNISQRRELERRKDEFISMASHELKTPITALKGFTQLLLRRFKNHGDEEALRFIARMDRQINKLTTLISDMLDLSKMQSGQLEYRMDMFDLVALVQEIVENVQETTHTHRIVLEQTIAAQVYGDRDRIGQVLINLLTNAIKYSKDADRVIVRMVAHEGMVLVSIQDFGIGISEAYQEKIFDQFYQVTEPTEKTYPGLGIGLYIARKIIERHQGHLRVQSHKGEGSTFSFQLPLAKDTSPKREDTQPDNTAIVLRQSSLSETQI
jgi:PAS domain S-box-containing protein